MIRTEKWEGEKETSTTRGTTAPLQCRGATRVKDWSSCSWMGAFSKSNNVDCGSGMGTGLRPRLGNEVVDGIASSLAISSSVDWLAAWLSRLFSLRDFGSNPIQPHRFLVVPSDIAVATARQPAQHRWIDVPTN